MYPGCFARQKVNIHYLEAANYDEDALFAAVESVAKSKNGAKSAKVVKRVLDDPHVGEPLYKHIKKLHADLAKMDDEFGRDEDGEIVTPIRALAYLLGLQNISCCKKIKILLKGIQEKNSGA